MHERTTDQESPAARIRMGDLINRIATGPELSKDLTQREACAGMRMILEGHADPVEAGVFLIALRMKRETDDENLGILDAIREASTITVASVDEVVDIADPYDGYARTLPPSPFLPAVLAACGVPAVSHGLDRVAPKYGLTHRHVLRAAGVDVDLSPAEAAARVADPAAGWAYVDQKAFCPALHGLVRLRDLIRKRPALATVEALVGPIRGKRRTHLVTGYVHKPYPRIYALLARRSGFDSALLVRGVEGGVIPSLRQTGAFVYYHDLGEERAMEMQPSDLGIVQTVRAAPLPGVADDAEDPAALDHASAAAAAAEAGLSALAGEPGIARDALIYGASMCLWHLRRHESPAAAAVQVREVLDRRLALKRLGRS